VAKKSVKPKNKKKIDAKTKQAIARRNKRFVAAILTIFALLLMISLASGADSIENDMQVLRDSGGLWDWFSAAKGETYNPIGIFGIVFGYISIWLFGFWLALALSLLLIVASFDFFVNPEKSLNLSWSPLLALALLFFQSIFTKNVEGFSRGILPFGLYRALHFIFKDIGSIIILSTGAVLSLILIFDWRKIKETFMLMIENIRRSKELRRKLSNEKPQVTINEMEDVPLPPEEMRPNIKDHQDAGAMPKVIKTEMKQSTPEQKPKSVEIEDEKGEMREYQMPSIEAFLESPIKLSDQDRSQIEEQIIKTSELLQDKFAEFNIDVEVKNVNIGPIITQYELEPAAGVKLSKIAALSDDLALAIKAKSIRIQAPIPGRGLVGIEIPNPTRDMIYLRDLLLSEDMRKHKSRLAFGLGKDIAGKPIVADLARMPHLLIAGATGSGKSVCINTILMSLIMRTTPDELRLILIDPKRVELTGYANLPHLIGEVITDPDSAQETMYWCVKEMERRLATFEEAKVRDISSYNEKCKTDDEMEKMPYIVIVIDEFADLIMTSGKDIEMPITRLAQMARAVGMHLILATQRPSIKVITGLIKANFPARIAFQVSTRVDSRVILDNIGAEKLLGSGDMLFIPPGKGDVERIHGAYVSDSEITRVNDYLAMQPKPKQSFEIKSDIGSFGGDSFDWDDELFPEAARTVVRSNTASVSMLQRHFKIGYARAGRIVDMLERAGIVGPHLGSKSRDVIATTEDLINIGVLNEED